MYEILCNGGTVESMICIFVSEAKGFQFPGCVNEREQI